MDRNDRITTIYEFLALACGLSIVAGTLISHANVAFNLRFNPYAILSLIGLISNTGLLFYIVSRFRRTPETLWFALFLVGVSFWAGGEMMARLSATPLTMLFWDNAAGVGACLAPTSFLLFSLAHVEQDSYIRRVPLIIALLTTAMMFMLIFISTDAIIYHSLDTVELFPWGYRPTFTPLYPILGAFMELGLVGGVILLWRKARQTIHPLERQQTTLFFWSMLIPLPIGTLTDAVLPKLGVHILPMTMLGLSITAAMVVYGTVRYRLFRLNPRTFAPGILQTMGEAVIVANPQWQIEFVNAGACSLLGVTVPELMGKNAGELFSAAHLGELKNRIAQANPTAPMVHLADTLLITPGGHDLPVSLAAAVIQDESSAVAGYSLVMTDLREIKAAERLLQQEKASVERKVVERTHELAEARAELEASIRSLPFGFAIVTPNNEVAFSNAQLSTLFNYPIPEGLSASKTALAAVSKDFAGTIDLIGCLEESRRSLAPIEKHVEFGPRFYRFVFLPITTDAKQVIGSALLMEDTTEAKAQERSRDEFFSIASHELRTPLTAIRGNSDMILQYYQQILQDPDLKQMINDIHDGSIRLISIVNDFLDVSRLEQRNIQFKNTSFDPVPVIEAILREFNVTGSRKKLTLALDPPASTHVPIYADPDRFRQIIINLVSNAIKFTEQGGITITIKSTDSVVQAAVTDTGHGIPLESQHLLFRKFQQAADSILTRSDTRSTGLGLYISKLLAEGMGGKLYLEKTEVGKGSTFVLDLPKASTDQPNPA